MCCLRLGWKVLWWLGEVNDKTPPWEPYCVEHDQKYHPGGSIEDRLAADMKLIEDVSRIGYPRLARLMFIGVSIGGHPLLPLPWRWGYGYRWPKGYTK